MSLFKNKALYVQMVEKERMLVNPQTSLLANDSPSPPPEWINEAILGQVRNVGITVAAVLAVSALLNTVSTVIVNNTDPSRRK